MGTGRKELGVLSFASYMLNHYEHHYHSVEDSKINVHVPHWEMSMVSACCRILKPPLCNVNQGHFPTNPTRTSTTTGVKMTVHAFLTGYRVAFGVLEWGKERGRGFSA